MSWRVFFIIGTIFAALILNTVLIVFEKVQKPDEAQDLEISRTDPLLSLTYTPASRNKNFKDFGLTDDLVGAAAQRTARLEGKYKARFEEKLVEFAEDVGWALCPGNRGLSQRYAVLSFLVEEQNENRKVIPPERLYFEEQEWWEISVGLVESVYDTFERDKHRREDATVMGIGAILLRKEEDALARTSPWGTGMGSRWSFGKMNEDNPGLDKKLVEYFALMHLLTELANQPSGICQ